MTELHKLCQWCEKKIEAYNFSFTPYKENILLVINYPDHTYYFDNKTCLLEWLNKVK